MATCDDCGKEMLTARTCKENIGVTINGKHYDPIPYEPLPELKKIKGLRCHDCGIRPGGIHHQGCDMEQCPNCNGQLISCDCDIEDSEDEDDFNICTSQSNISWQQARGSLQRTRTSMPAIQSRMGRTTKDQRKSRANHSGVAKRTRGSTGSLAE